ncbi:Eukaryotic translation initiation factor 3 subunit C like [Quillaja saponaria]|uniref:Eukaryotic translation initiation factor 3 subunit C like n=1 Tax=Quillaja saponaria TaxID=32244 RepID=A0AAD7L5A6_QUISA|nr:Eukaryotic translation initiation factor 3 subunit C like [Quillaja saponaria]
MALNKTLENLPTHEGIRSSECGIGESCPDELEVLESEVKQMAEKILEYRESLPDQLKNTFASVLAAHRPLIPDASEPGTSGVRNSDAVEQATSSKVKPAAQEDPEIARKIQLLKDKISSNVSAVPIVLKRMKDCIAKIDKLDSYNGIIHPAFKRKRTK